ncbi:MAG: hypothetical protein AB1651_08345, partial [Pseudomonadota bacterium]
MHRSRLRADDPGMPEAAGRDEHTDARSLDRLGEPLGFGHLCGDGMAGAEQVASLQLRAGPAILRQVCARPVLAAGHGDHMHACPRLIAIAVAQQRQRRQCGRRRQ